MSGPQDILGMSDADILNTPLPAADAVAPAADDQSAADDDTTNVGDDDNDTTNNSAADDADASDDATDADQASGKEDGADGGSDADDDNDDNTSNGGADDNDDSASDDQPADLDHKAIVERLFTPFKANGREMKVDNVEDAITLMQMGANYNKKMAALKPNLKLLKMLENHQLLDESKLNFLIDLTKKDPAAISKLVKDSGIDPMDLDVAKADGYKGGNYAVDDREYQLDETLADLRDSPAYPQTLDIVGTQWDGASRKVISDHPQILRVIHEHVENGVYQIIADRMATERALGRLSGLSDLEAYRQVGDMIHAQGGFAHLAAKGQQGQQTKPTAKVVTPKPKKVEDPKLNDRRRAASPSRPAASSGGVPANFNPLSMSDEEISKLGNPNFL